MGCIFSSDNSPPADFSLGEPEGFRKVQGWDANHQRIVQEGESEQTPNENPKEESNKQANTETNKDEDEDE